MRYDVTDIARICADRISQLDVVTNNLANINTPGFKFERLYFAAKNGNGKNADETPSFLPFLSVDYREGIMRKTDNALDAAIHGEGFFTIQTKEGTAYTRKGNFTVNKNNQLVTMSGDYVLGEKGPITVRGNNVHIDKEGGIKADGVEVGKFRIVKFENLSALVRHGDGLFTDTGGGGMKRIERPEISPNHLEMANVDVIREMAAMIDIQRSFESYQKVIQTMADLDKLSTSRVGRLA